MCVKKWSLSVSIILMQKEASTRDSAVVARNCDRDKAKIAVFLNAKKPKLNTTAHIYIIYICRRVVY